MSALRMVHDEEPAAYDAPPVGFDTGFVLIPAVFRTITGPIDVGDGRKPIAKGVLVAVYQAIASYADHRAVAYPSLKKIADDTGWSEDHVTRAVKALAMLEIIRIDQRESNGFKRSNQYVLVHHYSGKKHTADNGVVEFPERNSANERIPSTAGTHPAPTVTYPLSAGQVPADSGLSTRPQRVEQEPVELKPKEQDLSTALAPPNGFDAFWLAYPKHAEKKQAVDQWRRLKPSAELQATILAAIASQKSSRKWQEGYVKAPHRWLRDQNWQDEVEPEKKSGKGPLGLASW